MKLNLKNPHPRDREIQFEGSSHRYTLNKGQPFVSVSTLYNRFFPKFDEQYWAEQVAKNQGREKEDILREWEVKRIKSSKNGHYVHQIIEKYLNGEGIIDNNKYEFKHFLEFEKDFKAEFGLEPYRTEWIVWDDELWVAGTMDAVYKDKDGKFFIVDWKTNGKLDWVNKYGETAFPPFDHISNSELDKYSLQLSMYRVILEGKYGIKIEDCYVVWLCDQRSSYKVFKTRDFRKEALHMMRNHRL